MGLARHGQLRPLNKAGAHGRITETCLKEKEEYPIGEGWMIRSIGTNQRAVLGPWITVILSSMWHMESWGTRDLG